MRLGYVILYVPDVEATLSFYGAAFGLARRFAAGSDYGELVTGVTVLAFAAETMADAHGAKIRRSRLDDDEAPAAEIALVTDEPATAYARAVAAGAKPVAEPTKKAWGQTVGYVRDCNGFLVELCSPVNPPA